MRMCAAVGLWVLSAVICVGRGHDNDQAVKGSIVDDSVSVVNDSVSVVNDSVSVVNDANDGVSVVNDGVSVVNDANDGVSVVNDANDSVSVVNDANDSVSVVNDANDGVSVVNDSVSGVNDANDGVSVVNDSVSVVNDSVSVVNDANDSVSVVNDANDGISVVNDGVSVVNDSNDGVSVVNDSNDSVSVVNDANDGVSVVNDGVSVVNDGVSVVNDGVSVVNDGVSVVNDNDGVSVVNDGVSVVNDGVSVVNDTNDGVSVVNDANDGVSVVNDGVSVVNEANEEFSFRLYRKLAADADSQGKNIFFSPFSVSVALAALSVGAQGETHRQLFSGLGFNSSLLTQTDVDQAFQMFLQRANNPSQDASKGTAVFVDDRFKPEPEFLQTLNQSYFTDGFNVDFTNATESAGTINKYVEEKTNGKIDKLVENLDPNTVMYLISYIYYRGKWATPFDPKLTKQDDFNVDKNTKVPVFMMNLEDHFYIYYDDKLKTTVLQLAFTSSYYMLLMLPDVMATLENGICPNHVTKWLTTTIMKPRRYSVYIPKFSIKTSYNLNNVLSEMGMTDMFCVCANLRGISEKKGLAVSDVVHKATLDVDETGAEAAAATGIDIVRTAIRVPVPVLKFNRPFMVIITESNPEKILFLGKIINPNI
ncbi:serpin A3-5 isoform X6 [Perca flavescens]|uniref:serpin A3-5 isoform X6 n=1 Tax=Perca flavescens TaxID=8167 RepID=UPI00106E86DE|nr:serpin A3-5-like isoform X6 [Perca flavescens]